MSEDKIAKVRALRVEAAVAGDWEQVHLCDLAIGGDVVSVLLCLAVIRIDALESAMTAPEVTIETEPEEEEPKTPTSAELARDYGYNRSK